MRKNNKIDNNFPIPVTRSEAVIQYTKNKKKDATMIFNKSKILEEMEKLRKPSGVFTASSTANYNALWIRDTLYCSFAYWYLDEFEKLKQGVWAMFDLFKKYQDKIKKRIASPVDIHDGVIHAKFNAETFDEIVTDNGWGHHQLDALGLFLHIVADLDFKNVRVIRDSSDLEIIQMLIYYLRSVEYWSNPDFGMWEECKIRHSSSIGAVFGGLAYIKKQRLAVVPDTLIQAGHEALRAILPYESRDRCNLRHHNHDCDAAQLFLIWPYHIIVKPTEQDSLISRIIDGHKDENGEWHKLLQEHGLNRYWGDDYYRSTEGEHRGISAMWPMFLFLISIIFSQRHEYDKALYWFKEGAKKITDNKIPEAYSNDKPNDQTPLAWAHSIALIAFSKLPSDTQQKLQK